MGRVNISSLKQAIEAQSHSKVVQNTIKHKTLKTKNNIAESRMNEAGQLLFDTICSYLPDTLRLSLERNGTLSKTEITAPKQAGDFFRIDINIPPELLRRKSLIPNEYPEGIDNIIALFDKGYNAKKRVYGYWDSVGRRISSLTNRPALDFMQEAIEDFNQKYSSLYSCKAELGQQYK